MLLKSTGVALGVKRRVGEGFLYFSHEGFICHSIGTLSICPIKSISAYFFGINEIQDWCVFFNEFSFFNKLNCTLVLCVSTDSCYFIQTFCGFL